MYPFEDMQHREIYDGSVLSYQRRMMDLSILNDCVFEYSEDEQATKNEIFKGTHVPKKDAFIYLLDNEAKSAPLGLRVDIAILNSRIIFSGNQKVSEGTDNFMCSIPYSSMKKVWGEYNTEARDNPSHFRNPSIHIITESETIEIHFKPASNPVGEKLAKKLIQQFIEIEEHIASRIGKQPLYVINPPVNISTDSTDE